MKKLIFLSAMLIFSVLAFAQEPEKAKPSEGTPPSDMKVMPNMSVEMKDGKVWLLKDGKTTLVSSAVMLGGSKVSADGSVELADGTKSKLKDGDKVTADGKLVKAPLDKNQVKPEYK